MHHFLRAVRLALQQRFTLAGGIFCSLMVALLWGANLGTVYPFVLVVLQNRSIQDWVDEEIATKQAELTKVKAERASLQRDAATAPAAQRRQLEERAARRASEQETLEKSLGALRWAQPRVHRFLPDRPFTTLVLIVALLLLGTLLKDGFLVANMILVERLAQLTTFELRKEFYRRTLRMDLSAFGDDRTSELMSRFTYDMGMLTTGIKTLFGKTIGEPLKMIACLIGAGFICWRLLLFSLILAPPAIFLITRLARSLKRANRRAMEEMSQLYNLLSETFTGIHAVKAFTMERHERHRFHQTSKECYHKAMRIVTYDALAKPSTELMGIGVICLAILAGGYLVLNEQTHLFRIKMTEEKLSFAALLTFYALVAGVSDPARKLADVLNNLQRGAAAADRVYEMLDREPRVVEPLNAKSMPDPHGELIFDRVSFHYVEDCPVLQDIELRIPFGETLAIIGSNGCGKSTLVNLIPRFYDPVEGAVRLDDIDLRDVRLRDLRSRIGLVIQQTLLFDDTVMNNIRYGSPWASDQQVIEAAEKAHAHQFIVDRLEDGYQTIVGERGGKLSGGQRQRIALARAILRDPQILILDEATSQIDPESEQLIHKVLQQFVRGRTTIMITHRLSTLALADRILVMDAGQIADVGTHDELMRRCGLYQRLYRGGLRETA